MHMTGHKSLVMVDRDAQLAPEYRERAIIVLNRYGRELGGVASGVVGELPRLKQNPLVSQGVMMVEPDGIEPTTPTMP